MPPRVTLHRPRPHPEARGLPPARAFARLLARAGVSGGEVNLVLTDGTELRRLNRRFLGQDRETDVIAFDYLQDDAAHAGRRVRPAPAPVSGRRRRAQRVVGFPRERSRTAAGRRRVAPDVVTPERIWGDVYVSADAALAQARDLGIPLREELARLLLHGCLHLLGYRDGTRAERARMEAMQESLLPGLLGAAAGRGRPRR